MKMRWLAALAAIALYCVPARAQNPTAVTGTILDSNSVPYYPAQVTACLTPVTLDPTVGGKHVSTNIGANYCVAAQTAVDGSFSMGLFANANITPAATQWLFTVVTPGTGPPAGKGPQSFTTSAVTISGTSQSVTSSFTGLPALLNAGGGSSSSSAQGPVINVTAAPYSASSALADNATAFAAAATAANAVSLTAGNPAVKNVSAVNVCVSQTTCAATINISPGDTVLFFLGQSGIGRTNTFTDTGGNYYFTQTPYSANGSATVVLGATAPSGAAASATSVTVTSSGAAQTLVVAAITFSNVGSYKIGGANATGASATPAFSQTTNDTNNILVSLSTWFDGTVKTVSQNTGILQASVASGAAQDGMAVVTQVVASPAATTNNVTLSGSSTWNTIGIELRSRTNVQPTLYVPYGTYFYSSGLALVQPQTLKCEPGTVLYYTGTGVAVSLGPTSFVATNFFQPYYVDGCTFMGGQSMTAGVQFNSEVIVGGIRHTRFLNFGNSTAFMIQGMQDNWDIEIGPQVRIHVTDGVPRNILKSNVNALNDNSFFRVHDVEAYCLTGESSATSGCTASQTGIGFILDSATSFVQNSNIAFFNPDIRLSCSVTPCYGQRVEHNILETVSGNGSGTGVCPIQFQGTAAVGNQDRILVHDNTANVHGLTTGFVCPLGGTDLLSGARVNFNAITNIADATPVVVLNNTAGQSNNQSSNNLCSIVFASQHPCVTPHTTGASISNFTFNVDDQHVAGLYATTTNCSSSGGTCAAAPAGSVSIAAAATTVTVATTAVTANSQIILARDDTLGTKLSVTCNTATAAGDIKVSTRTAGTSFVITVQNAPVTNPLCLSYWILN